MELFKKIVVKLNDLAGYGSSFLIAANMVIVTYSVIMRLLFDSPLSGLTDVVGFISAGSAALAFGYTEKERGFMQVDFVKEYFPKSVQMVIHLVLGLISIAALAILTWRFIIYGISCYQLGTMTWVAFLPYWPICILLVIGCALYTLTTVYHFIIDFKSIKGVEK